MTVTYVFYKSDKTFPTTKIIFLVYSYIVWSCLLICYHQNDWPNWSPSVKIEWSQRANPKDRMSYSNIFYRFSFDCFIFIGIADILVTGICNISLKIGRRSRYKLYQIWICYITWPKYVPNPIQNHLILIFSGLRTDTSSLPSKCCLDFQPFRVLRQGNIPAKIPCCSGQVH